MPTAPISSSTTTGPLGGAPTQKSQWDGDVFMKLLMAQMQHQDPTKPTDSAAMLTQLAQFTSVQSLNTIEKQLGSLQKAQHVASALTTIGQRVYWNDGTGEQSGIVDAVRFAGTSPTLQIGNIEIPASQVTRVGGQQAPVAPDAGDGTSI